MLWNGKEIGVFLPIPEVSYHTCIELVNGSMVVSRGIERGDDWESKMRPVDG